ncbi:MAG: dockerin type I repeat-containing protein [Ruminococcus sp.]|nr:dockerin type I repeat-containing protein [Ruminococcus sp.]
MKKRRLLNIITAFVMSFALMCVPVGNLSADAAEGRLYNQYEEKWQNVIFNKYALTQNSMYISGCGIFSFCNAIYALNGNAIDAVNIAAWAVDNGSYQPGNGGMYYLSFYNTVESGYGELFNFSIDGHYYGRITDQRLINHLKNGGVATIHVYGHLMAVTGYNEINNTYHVIESAVSSTRGLEPDGWVSAEKMCSGTTNVDWYALISDTTPPVTEVPDAPQLSSQKTFSADTPVKITWDSVENTDYYSVSVYRDDELYTTIEPYENTEYTENLPEGKYTFCLNACNVVGKSAESKITFWVGTVRGDINSDNSVDESDLILLQNYLLSLESFDEKQYKSADINSDGTVNSFDMVLLRRWLINR